MRLWTKRTTIAKWIRLVKLAYRALDYAIVVVATMASLSAKAACM